MHALAISLVLIPLGLIAAQPAAEDRWQADMHRFDQLDEETPPTPGGVIFVGSSSIRLWDLTKSFPETRPLNRGFGGSVIADSIRHVDRLVLRHRPRTVVFYAGDNDIARGMSAEEVAKDFQKFVGAVHHEFPETKIVFISIKPSLARWQLADEMRKANAAIRQHCQNVSHCEFVDVWPAMLGDDGTPRAELLADDKLHLSEQGYAVWTKLVKPHLD
jgi:lysophospholipase L1-like esterase